MPSVVFLQKCWWHRHLWFVNDRRHVQVLLVIKHPLLIILFYFAVSSDIVGPDCPQLVQPVRRQHGPCRPLEQALRVRWLLHLGKDVSTANDLLQITTTCLQRPLFWSPVFLIWKTMKPTNNDHLSTTATIFGLQRWSLYTGLTVLKVCHNFAQAFKAKIYEQSTESRFIKFLG